MSNELSTEDKLHDIALRTLENIIEMYLDYQKADDDYDEEALEIIQEKVQEYPLDFSVRSGWVHYKSDMEPEEFNILITTGGPAVRIVGDIDLHDSAENINIEAQDWFTPWTALPSYKYPENGEEALEWFCNIFTGSYNC